MPPVDEPDLEHCEYRCACLPCIISWRSVIANRACRTFLPARCLCSADTQKICLPIKIWLRKLFFSAFSIDVRGSALKLRPAMGFAERRQRRFWLRGPTVTSTSLHLRTCPGATQFSPRLNWFIFNANHFVSYCARFTNPEWFVSNFQLCHVIVNFPSRIC